MADFDFDSMSDDQLLALYQQEKAKLSGVPEGAEAAPEYGEGAYKTPDGMIIRGKQVLRGAQTANAEARTRLKLGLGPTIEAQKNLFKAEGWNPDRSLPGEKRLGRNPYDSMSGMASAMLRGKEAGPLRTMMANKVGGQEYQDYDQASKSFEAAFMPILSGAAVTESEAQRLIRASLPAPGDTPKTLAKKAKNRAMMINGAAELLGNPKPFPRVQSYDFKGGQAATSSAPATTKRRLVYDPATGDFK